jgi:hypothetical protein
VAGLARARWRELLPLAARGAAALVLGAAMLLGTNFALSGELAWTPGGYGIVFARNDGGRRRRAVPRRSLSAGTTQAPPLP